MCARWGQAAKANLNTMWIATVLPYSNNIRYCLLRACSVPDMFYITFM